MTGTYILLAVMVGFMLGAIVGELADQHAADREARDMAEAEEWLAELRAAFADTPALVAA